MLAFASIIPGSFWFGFALSVVAALWLAGTMQFPFGARTVRGEIVEMEWHLDHGQCEYVPHFRYTLPDGRSYTRRSALAFAVPRYVSGDVVEVLYHPDEPEEAELKMLRARLYVPAGAFVAGLTLMAAALSGYGF